VTAVEGGLLDRLILMSARHMVKDSLTALGWFDAGRYHEPITWLEEQVPTWEKLEANTIIVSLDTMEDEPAELGSSLTIDDHALIVDVYAKTEGLARHLAGDCRDILRGKMPSIGRTAPVLDVLDYRQATPTRVSFADIEKVHVDAGAPPGSAKLQFWRSVMCNLSVDVD
jgi:hypothetical protein